MSERKIQVSLTANTHDNKHKPYFWVILEWNKDTWINTGKCGWESTPQKAWESAITRA